MGPVRWTCHALANLSDREIERSEADRCIAEPEAVETREDGRRLLMRRYFDRGLGQEMLIRVAVEDAPSEAVVVTVYKTSRFGKYLKGRAP
jgi:hypothetical protein